MTDRLGEALATWDARIVPPPEGSVLPTIVAAARAWHTLTFEASVVEYCVICGTAERFHDLGGPRDDHDYDKRRRLMWIPADPTVLDALTDNPTPETTDD